MTYVVKTRPGCPESARIVALLTKHGAPFIEQKHETPLAVGAFYNAGFKAFPVVFFKGQHVGGYAELLTRLGTPAASHAHK